MKRITVISTVLLAAALAANAAMLGQGTRQLDVSGTIDDDGNDVGVALSLSAGYFVMDHFEVGAGAAGAVRGDFKNISAAVLAEYYLDVGMPVYPYAGASVGLAWMDNDIDSNTYLELTGYGGAKYFLVETLAIGADLQLKFASDDVYNDGDNFDWLIRLHTSFYF